MESMGNNMTTNLEFGEMLGLFDYAMAGLNMESLSLEGYDDNIKGVYYYHLEESSVEEVGETFKEHLEIISNVATTINQ